MDAPPGASLAHNDFQLQNDGLEDSNLCNSIFPDETVIMEVVSQNIRNEEGESALQTLLRKADLNVDLVERTMARLNITYSEYVQNPTKDVEESFSLYSDMSELKTEIGKLVAMGELMADIPEAETKTEDLKMKVHEAEKICSAIEKDIRENQVN